MLQYVRHFEVIDEADGGEEAGGRITGCEDSKNHDLVLCDIRMDEGPGIELLKRCRNHPDFRHIPFIMISASFEPASIAAALGEWGANDSIVRPFSYEILDKRVDSLLKRLKSPEEAIFRQMGNLAKAVEAMKYIGKVSPADSERAFLPGKLMLMVGRKGGGARCIKSLIKRRTVKERESFVGKAAQVFMESGLFEEAKEVYMRSLDFTLSDLETINRLGLLLRQRGKYDEARQCYLGALKKHPGHPGLHHNLGVLYVTR